MGTREIDAADLSFADRMEMIIETEPGEGLEEIDNDGDGWYHNGWGRGGVKIRIAPADRDRPHRPEVGDDALDALDEWVGRNHPNVPVESIDFDEKLTLLLDTAEEYYEALDCRLQQAAAQELGENMAGDGFDI